MRATAVGGGHAGDSLSLPFGQAATLRGHGPLPQGPLLHEVSVGEDRRFYTPSWRNSISTSLASQISSNILPYSCATGGS